MASFTLTIADTDVIRVTQALCRAGGYAVTGVAATDEANALAAVMAHIAATVANIEASEAQAAALAAITPPPPVSMS